MPARRLPDNPGKGNTGPPARTGCALPRSGALRTYRFILSCPGGTRASEVRDGEAPGRKTVPSALLYRRRMGRRDRPRDGPGAEPGDRRDARHGAEDGRRGDPPRDRGGRPGLAGVARQNRQGTRADPAQMVRPDDGEPGRSGDPDDRRAGQAAGRGERRDRLCGLVHRMVRRGGQAHLRRHDPGARVPTSASSCSRSRSASAPRSRRGTSRPR